MTLEIDTDFKQYDSLPVAIALFDNQIQNRCIYSNKAYNNLFTNQKLGIYKNINEYFLTKTNTNQNIKIFEHSSNILGCVFQVDNNILDVVTKATAEATKERIKFLSRVSHDLRTPLNAILGVTNIIAKDLNDQNKIIKGLSIIENSSNHLLDLINSILEMMRIENGKSTIVEEATNLESFLDMIVSVITPQSLEKQLKIEVAKNIETDNVLVDKIKIKQVLINLLSNAIKYNKVNGYVHFNINETKLNSEYSKFEFIIEDSGIGMDEVFISKLFIPYTRANEGIPGTGIGLTISKSTIDLLGGDIKVDSKLGIGTKFTVSFILKIINEKATTLENNNLQINLSDKKILVVEDNKINIEITKEILNSVKATVELAENGKEAIELFKNNPKNYYDLIFMDVQMPVMNGYEATKEIRKIDKNVPIIGMSANVFYDDISTGLACGMTDYLGKPVSVDETLNLLQKYIK